MIFHRSIPERVYLDYTAYRALLRRDFQYRCAYCLMQEFYLGGEAGCCIDHHHPIKGLYGRPDLINVYVNLFWVCRECNDIKADKWPSPADYAAGIRFLDPCNPEDDHDLHCQILSDGKLLPLTPAGHYTIRKLKLWRGFLQHHRAKRYRMQEEAQMLEGLLTGKRLTEAHRRLIETHLNEVREWLEPPVFDRPRGNS